MEIKDLRGRFLEYIKEEKNNEYEVVSKEFISNQDQQITVKHKICGYEYPINIHDFKRKGRGCKKCKGLLNRTTEEFKAEMETVYPGMYEVLGEYVNNKTPILMKHIPCGTIKLFRPDMVVIKQGNGSQICSVCNRKIKRTKEDIESQVFNRFPDSNVTIDTKAEDIINVETMLDITCLKCNNKFKYTANVLISLKETEGGICPFCERDIYNRHRTIKTFKQEIINETDYEVVDPKGDDERVFRKEKIIFLHKKCGRTFPMSVDKFINNRRCPLCLRSKSEEQIATIFKEANEDFIPQYQIPELGLLRFDFYIPRLKIILEYDGEFHYIRGIFGHDNLDKQQARDKSKSDFCIANNISLIRIPFWEQSRIPDHVAAILAGKTPEFLYKTYEEFQNSKDKAAIEQAQEEAGILMDDEDEE